MKEKLNELQLDALREVTNIGAGHAAIALSQLLERKIMIAVTRSEIVPSKIFLKKVVGSEDDIAVGVYLKTLGDIQGAMVFMFKKESALKLSAMLLRRKEGEAKFVDEKAQSALKEVGSILTGAFLTVLGDMLEFKVFHKTPYYAFDKSGIIMYGVCEEMFGSCIERLCIATEFIESGSQITGSFAFIPDNKAMDKILARLGQ